MFCALAQSNILIDFFDHMIDLMLQCLDESPLHQMAYSPHKNWTETQGIAFELLGLNVLYYDLVTRL